MEELTLNDQTVLFDREATISAYKAIENSWADTCPCATCRNFLHFRQEAYSPALLALLARLGIDPMKEWEVFSVGVEVDNLLQYGGWFPFVGEWALEKDKIDVLNLPKFSIVRPDEFFFTQIFPNARKAFGNKVLAVEFKAQTPKARDYVSDWV